MTQENPESPPQQPGTALVRIKARLRELEKMPEVHGSNRKLGEDLGFPVGVGMLLIGTIVSFAGAIVPPLVPAIIISISGIAIVGTGFAAAMTDTFGLSTKADKKRLALQGERKQLLLELSQERKQAEQKQREEAAEKQRQRCERLKALACAQVRSIKDENLRKEFAIELPDPDDAARILRVVITEVVTCQKQGATVDLVTARVYHAIPSSEVLKAPEVEGLGPIQIERPVPDIGPLRLPEVR